MIKIPPNQQWTRTNSDLLGSLWSGLNLNLTEESGKTKVSTRMILTNNGVTNMACPVAFRVYNSKLMAMARNGNLAAFISTNSIVNGGTKDVLIAEASSGGGATTFNADYSDMEVFNSKLFSSGDSTDLLYFDTSTWTALTSKVTGSAVHKFLNFLNLKRLYVTASLTQIVSMNTSFTVATSGSNTLNIATATGTSDLFLTTLLQTNNLIWVLTANLSNNECFVYTWDGVTADTINSAFRINARGILAGIVKDNTPYVLDCDGQLYYFNGGSFVPAKNGKLPIKPDQFLTNPISQKNDRWIHPNGITLVDGRINVLINNLNHDNASTINENLPSGVWEYDSDIGWYPKRSLTQYDYSAVSPAVTDYGQVRLSRVGALYNIKSDDRSSDTTVGTLIAGANYYTDASTVKSGIWINDSLDLVQKYGYLITTKILAANVRDVFTKIYARIKPLLTATDKIWVKYRSSDAPPVEATITWVSSTSFTTTTDVSAYGDDDEVEVTQGTGGGFCSQIQSVTNNAGTYTVVVKDSFPSGVTGTAKARFQHWHSAGSHGNNLDNLADFNIGEPSPTVQLKVCMLLTGDNQIYDLLLDSELFQ